MKEVIKYFIEHKETHLWWYSETDYSQPHFSPTFNGGRVRTGYKRKSCWTNDPNHPNIAYNTKEEAERAMWFRGTIDVSDNELEVTEHLFL